MRDGPLPQGSVNLRKTHVDSPWAMQSAGPSARRTNPGRFAVLRQFHPMSVPAPLSDRMPLFLVSVIFASSCWKHLRKEPRNQT